MTCVSYFERPVELTEANLNLRRKAALFMVWNWSSIQGVATIVKLKTRFSSEALQKFQILTWACPVFFISTYKIKSKPAKHSCFYLFKHRVALNSSLLGLLSDETLKHKILALPRSIQDPITLTKRRCLRSRTAPPKILWSRAVIMKLFLLRLTCPLHLFFFPTKKHPEIFHCACGISIWLSHWCAMGKGNVFCWICLLYTSRF